MRGKDFFFSLFDIEWGITPAYAGKSAYELRCLQTFWDHPRVCGEKHLLLCLAQDLFGSPPRMRGKASLIGSAFDTLRITPAYAGKSLLVRTFGML